MLIYIKKNSPNFVTLTLIIFYISWVIEISWLVHEPPVLKQSKARGMSKAKQQSENVGVLSKFESHEYVQRVLKDLESSSSNKIYLNIQYLIFKYLLFFFSLIFP